MRDPAKLKVVLCTRRSGKTYGAGLWLVEGAHLTPGSSSLYVALTRASAKRIMWRDVLKVIDREKKLGGRFNETELSVTFPNGSAIYLLGLDADEGEKEKALGQKFRRVAVDEAASYSIDLNELVFGVLKPAVADYRGEIALIGTPGNFKRGLFFDLTKGQDPGASGTWEAAGWSGHRWSAFDNPHIREKWVEEIADLKRMNPRIEETPLFQQHYLGRWVIDDTQLVYRYEPGRNDFGGKLPAFAGRGRWHYVLGIDLGFADSTAWSVCAYHDLDRTLYVVETDKAERLDITDVAVRTRALAARYEFDALVVDGANKQAVEEMRRRHDLPLRAADKTGKVDFIELMNGDFISGRIKLDPVRCAPLVEEYAGLIWDERSTKREEHPAAPNHVCDATLYAWRHCYAYLAQTPAALPARGSPQAYEAASDALEVAAEQQVLGQQDDEWGW